MQNPAAKVRAQGGRGRHHRPSPRHRLRCLPGVLAVALCWLSTAPALAQSLSVTVSGVGDNEGTLTLANAGSSTFQSYKSFSIPYKDCQTLSSAVTTISWTNLNSNTNYRFTLYSDNNCATSLITAPRFKTLPGKPTKPTATAGNSGELTIAASVTGNPPLDKWQYIKKEGTAAWESDWTDISSTDKALSHTVTGLKNGVNYQFKVRAVNSPTSTGDFGGGTGADSDASDAVKPTGPTLTSSSVTATGATLNMASHTGNWYYKHTTPRQRDVLDRASPAHPPP